MNRNLSILLITCLGLVFGGQKIGDAQTGASPKSAPQVQNAGEERAAQTPAASQQDQVQKLDQKYVVAEPTVRERPQTMDRAGEQVMLRWAGPKETNARAVSGQAQDLIQKRQWQGAYLMLEQAVSKCGDAVTEDAKSCHAVLNSANGYVKLQESASVPPQSPQAQLLLQSAAESYAKAVSLQPTNGPVLSNLASVLAKMGKNPEAQDTLSRAIAVDPGRTAFYATRLGELQVQQKQWAAALESYGRAAVAAPDSALPARRILDVYRRADSELPANQKLALISMLGVWETTAPELARSGYELVMLRNDTTDVQREQMLLRWTDLLIKGRELNLGVVQGLAGAAGRQQPGGELVTALRDLSSYLQNPWQQPAPENWWMKKDERRTVLAGVALAWGREHQIESGPQTAERCWQTGLRVLPAGAEYGGLRIRGALQLSLDLRLELISLYDRFPNLDPYKRNAQELVGQLFSEKMSTISSGDVEAEQRYHTVLGLLFAQRKQWNSPDAANATYQLRRALDIARQRYQDGPEQGFYEPLPELRGLLAEAYRSAANRVAAANAAVDTAMAYMDTDDLNAAGRWVETAHECGAADNLLQQLRSLLSFRRSLVHSGSLAGATIADISPNQQPWLFNMGVPEDFLKRQRFKVFADLAMPPPADERAWNAVPPVEAFKLMLDGKGSPLVGGADLRRWEKVSGILLTSLSVPGAPTQLAPAARTFPEGYSAADFAPWRHFPAGDRTLLLTLPGDPAPTRILVSPLTVTAWRVVRALDAPGLSSVHQFMQVDASGITIRKDAPLDTIRPYLQKLQGAGVAVRIPQTETGHSI